MVDNLGTRSWSMAETKRTSAAKAGLQGNINGTAEAVPLSRTLIS
jgi:hypothetical protein